MFYLKLIKTSFTPNRCSGIIIKRTYVCGREDIMKFYICWNSKGIKRILNLMEKVKIIYKRLIKYILNA